MIKKQAYFAIIISPEGFAWDTTSSLAQGGRAEYNVVVVIVVVFYDVIVYCVVLCVV